ncbi:MAG: molybdopterin-guanine dinucleotide biosynthesis protein B [Rhodospirillales bacterium]|nr:molybdopterin-guanine dinucleotide biosynthesis protein B [Rhodospirillales bacterium]
MPDPEAEAGAGRQRVLGLAGWSGSGKTTLVTAMIPLLAARGHSVSTLKHAHHRFDIDRPGKDSFRHREAGAQQVLVSSAARWALITEHRGAPEPDSATLLAKMEPVDLVIVEGFKREAHDKLEVFRPSLGKPALWPEDPHVVAVASDTALPDCPRPVLPLNDAGAVANFVIRHCGLASGETLTWPS